MTRRIVVVGAVAVVALVTAGALVLGRGGDGGLAGRADAAWRAAARPGAGEVAHVRGAVVTEGRRGVFDTWRLGPDGSEMRVRSRGGDPFDSSLMRDASGEMISFDYRDSDGQVLMTAPARVVGSKAPDPVGFLSDLYASGAVREIGPGVIEGRKVLRLDVPPEAVLGPGLGTAPGALVRLSIDAGTLLPVRLEVPEATGAAKGQRIPAYSVVFDEIATTPIDERGRRDLLDLRRVYPRAPVERTATTG